MTQTRRARSVGADVPRAAFLLAILALTAACSLPIGGIGGPDGSGAVLTGSGGQQPGDRLHQQANDALARWADAVRASGGASVTFVGSLTNQIGDWEAAVGENNKIALMAGKVVASASMSTETPSRDKVRWLDGSTVDVGVVSAADALAALVADAETDDCDGCRPLEITDAQLATGIVETSLGPANAPIWAFSVFGSAVKVTRVAVDESVTVDPPPWNAANPPEGIAIQSVTGAPGAKRLTVTFIGAPRPGDQGCGADYTAEAVESALAVVVIVHELRNAGSGSCTGAGAARTAKVTLADVLGKRVVLEVQQGLPVPVLAP